MNMRATRKIVVRELLLSFVYTTIWFVTLFAVSYPADMWVGVVVIAYVSLCVSRVLIVNLTVFVLTKLHEYGSQVLARVGIEPPSLTGGPDNRASHAATLMFLVGILATIFGLTLTATGAWASAAGLLPLSRVFDFVGWTTLSVGMGVLVVFFAGSYLLFRGAEALSSKLSSRVNYIERSESLVRRWGARLSPLSASD